MVPKNRPPTHPGEILLEEFLTPLNMTQVDLAARMGVPVQRVNTLIAGKRGVTAETAVLLARIFENSPQFWMNLQNAVDLYAAEKRLAAG
jgi:addiction module HigA family antidote